MKQILSMIFAGLVGGMAAILVTSQNSSNTITELSDKPSFVRTTNQSPNTLVAGFDFVEASEKVTPTVVHIEASQSKTLAQQDSGNRNRGRNSPVVDTKFPCP